VIAIQSKVYIDQRKIMNGQSDFMNSQTQIMQQSLNVSQQSLRASEQSFRVSERAYVGIASLNANLEAGEIVLLLQNIGRLPAKAVKLEGAEVRVTPSGTDERTESGEPIYQDQEGSEFHWTAGEVQLFPGTPMSVAIHMRQLKEGELSAILNKKEILFVGGTIQYEDGFGNRDNTTFAFQYNPPPHERWTAHSDLSKFFNLHNQ
jgi:hypothetical protein